jgi:superfamily II DNA or RNA helicase
MLPPDDLFSEFVPADGDVERAAIAEIDGKVPRPIAERMAAEGAPLVLRPYQENAITSLRERLQSSVRRIILYAPTGSGKTEIAGAIVRAALAKDKRVLFVCHMLELITQTSARFYGMNLPHGILQGDNTRGLYNNLVIGSIQTIDRRKVDDFDLIIVDEAHACAASKAYHRLFARFKDRVIIGLTATPFARGLGRHHDAMGGTLFQELIAAATIRELIRDGYLVDCDIFGPTEPDLSQVKIVAGDYHEEQLAEAVDKPALIGDIVGHKIRHATGQQAIVFAVNIAHSKHIVEQFRERGVTAEHIDAYTPDHERKRIIREFRQGKVEILSNVSVLAEGFDVKAVSVMILARPTRSLTRYIQMAGRVLRTAPGKTKALIFDHSGTCRRLGFPTEDLPLELDDGKPKTSSGSKAKEKPLPKLCVSCSYLKPAKVHKCPNCGFAPEKRSDVEVADGELKRLSKAERTHMKVEEARLWAELRWIQEERGHKPGWVWHKFIAKTGHKPAREIRGTAPRRPSADTLSWLKSQAIRWAHSKNNQANNRAA